jgi:hypothetical protein
MSFPPDQGPPDAKLDERENRHLLATLWSESFVL